MGKLASYLIDTVASVKKLKSDGVDSIGAVAILKKAGIIDWVVKKSISTVYGVSAN